jgi:hypothetical protein
MKTISISATLALALASLPQTSLAQTPELSFFIQCRFSANAAEREALYILLEVSEKTAISTHDPAYHLEGAVFEKVSLPDRGIDEVLIDLRSGVVGQKSYALLIQSRSPRNFVEPGLEVSNGFLLRQGESEPRKSGVCAVARTSQAREFFEAARSSSREVTQ